MDLTCSFGVEATMVANEFIDRYMAEANGEYVKVYLYILRHQHEKLDMDGIADALNHTEADVRRALAYWEKLGTLKLGGGDSRFNRPAQVRAAERAETRADRGKVRTVQQEPGSTAEPAARLGGSEQTGAVGREPISAPGSGHYGGGAALSAQKPAAEMAASRPVYSQEQVNRLQDDGEFAQLLYIAQRYLNKIFTQRELEVFAYLYDGLHMSTELLEYLVEYCVQSGHTSIRYIETVALSWHEKGFATVEEAKAYASGFTKDSFSVMRAFGLTDRKPGNAEKEMIERWFKIYGFTREVVLEACNRTLEATHKPSFQYAEKILSEWKKAGVKGLTDISALDEKRRSQGRQTARSPKKQTNQFHNFEQRNTDYDSMVLDQVKEWLSE